jgi:hypothetical protein
MMPRLLDFPTAPIQQEPRFHNKKRSSRKSSAIRSISFGAIAARRERACGEIVIGLSEARKMPRLDRARHFLS